MLPENVNWNAVLQSITDTWLPLIGMVAAIILVTIIVHVAQKNKKPSYSRHIRAPILNRRLLRKSRPPVLFAYQSVSSSVWRP